MQLKKASKFMRIAVRRRWLFAGLIGISIATGSVWIYAAIKGPYICGDCSLGFPVPDKSTANTMLQHASPWPFNHLEAGNVYIVCNAAYCAEYTITDDLGIYGTKKQPRTETPSAGGGARGGGGGTSGTGGDCVASCGQGAGSAESGTVDVGEVEKLPPKKQK
ncbi:MAG: hypothetical protein HOQ32_06130 [Lysobacter sp.]|nr:hypothetical protein [Lysobacter sp.]